MTLPGGARRAKIPAWALPVLLALPLWAYAYQGTLEPPPEHAEGPVALGEAVYRRCAHCHRADGGGQGAAPALTAVAETFPDWRDHLAWVALGSSGWPGPTYGEGRERSSGMPGFRASLGDAELAQVVLYERVAFGGLEEGSDAHVALLEVAEGERSVADVLATEGLGPSARAAGVDPADVRSG